MISGKIIVFASSLLLVSAFPWTVAAQDKGQEEEEEEYYYEEDEDTGGEYEEGAPDMTPGIHVYDKGKGSSLAKAARLGGSVIIGEDVGMEPEEEKNTYKVKEGDTLWDICVRQFGDPYVWPRIWSYNTVITNPNWIYPGETIWLEQPPALTAEGLPIQTQETVVETPSVTTAYTPSAILIRNRGFVDKETLEKVGTLVGAYKQTVMLAQFDEAYVEFKKGMQPRVGDEFAAFKILRPVDGIDDPGTEIGKLVEILAMVRVSRYDPSTRIARIVIDEAITPIERGTMIGPVHRRFDLIPAVPNDRDLSGHIVAFLDPIVLAGAQHVVFVDRGIKDGVREGNRFLAIEKRDKLRQSLGEPDDRDGYPIEVIAEMRVIETRPHTSTCLVTSTIRELEIGEKVELRRGY